MDKNRFKDFLYEAAHQALLQAGLEADESEPLVEYHGQSNPAQLITLSSAAELLWLSPDRIYFIIDVGAYLRNDGRVVIFIRPSGHEPRPFANTWNPDELGPFKVIGQLGPSESRPAN
ncbi:MAG: hypothetical protein AB1429_12150 [Pseudomonadota bacterium]